MLKQLLQHLTDNDLLEDHQSAYRTGHSTETAVLSVIDGLLVNADNRQVSMLALLDLSAAFDTLDHSIMLTRLERTFGISQTALTWFSSYLDSRQQCVSVGGHTSEFCPLNFGVPQGSVLGPVLFTLYTQPLSDVISSHQCDFHKYADDTEINRSAPPDQFDSAQHTVSLCVDDVLRWMTNNYLKLNTDKTEAMPVSTSGRSTQVQSTSVTIDGHKIPFQSNVKYLGVVIDQSLTFHDHISTVCRNAFLQIRRISSIRRCLSTSSAAKLVLAMVISRLDYCNSILHGLPADEISRLKAEIPSR